MVETERTDCLNREKDLQSEGTICRIEERDLLSVQTDSIKFNKTIYF